MFMARITLKRYYHENWYNQQNLKLPCLTIYRLAESVSRLEFYQSLDQYSDKYCWVEQMTLVAVKNKFSQGH